MPQRKSAKKELKKGIKRRERNLQVKKQLKSTIKSFKKSIENKDADSLRQELKGVYKILDKAASKGIIHPNKAARNKSRFTSLINSKSKTSSSPFKKKTTS